MATKKISALTELELIRPNDYIPIVDASSGTTKRILLNSLIQPSYYADPDETDHGAVGSGRSLKDLIDAIGSYQATIVFTHHDENANSTTTYTLTTNETVPSNIQLVFQNGAIIDGAGTLTINSPENIQASSRQQIFGSSLTVVFTNPGWSYAEWWEIDGTADEVQINAALQASKFVRLLGRSYVTAASITLDTNGMKLAGHKDLTTITYSGSGTGVNAANAAATTKHILLGDFELVGTGSGAVGIGLERTWHSVVDRVYVRDFTAGTGLRMFGDETGPSGNRGSYFNHVKDSFFDNCTDGVRIETANFSTTRYTNSNLLTNVVSENNAADGINIDAASDVVLIKPVVQSNGANGIHIGESENTYHVTIVGGWGEANTTMDLAVAANGYYVSSMGFYPNSATGKRVGGAGVENVGNRYHHRTYAIADPPTDYANWVADMGVKNLRVDGGTFTLHDGALVTTIAQTLYVTTDTVARLAVQYDGKHMWGAGGASAVDTNLYRDAANVLKTDDKFVGADGLVTKVAVTDTANPPTQAELVTAFGAAAAAAAGFIGVLDDAGGGANVYIVTSDGTNWFYQLMTVGA